MPDIYRLIRVWLRHVSHTDVFQLPPQGVIDFTPAIGDVQTTFHLNQN